MLPPLAANPIHAAFFRGDFADYNKVVTSCEAIDLAWHNDPNRKCDEGSTDEKNLSNTVHEVQLLGEILRKPERALDELMVRRHALFGVYHGEDTFKPPFVVCSAEGCWKSDKLLACSRVRLISRACSESVE